MGPVPRAERRPGSLVVARLTSETWHQEVHHAPVEALHGLGVPERATRLLRVCRPTDSALVLGRSQPLGSVDGTALSQAGHALVRRSSGGGAVLVVPGEIFWFDVVVPAEDPLWHADVNQAFWWLGDVIAAALGDTVPGVATVHRGALQPSPWSRAVCLAGLGPGEVLVDGVKAVGISQKRARAGALFQCSVALGPVSPIVDLMALDDAAKAALRSHLGTTVAFFEGLGTTAFWEALVHRLAVETLR